MREFFSSLALACVVGAVCVSLVGKAYEKQLRYVIALLFTVLTVLPLLNFIAGKPWESYELEFDYQESISTEDLLAEQLAEDTEKAVAEYIFSESGIKVAFVSIQIESVEAEYLVKKIDVKLNSAADRDAVVACLDELTQGKVETEVYG